MDFSYSVAIAKIFVSLLPALKSNIACVFLRRHEMSLRYSLHIPSLAVAQSLKLKGQTLMDVMTTHAYEMGASHLCKDDWDI